MMQRRSLLVLTENEQYLRDSEFMRAERQSHSLGSIAVPPPATEWGDLGKAQLQAEFLSWASKASRPLCPK